MNSLVICQYSLQVQGICWGPLTRKLENTFSKRNVRDGIVVQQQRLPGRHEVLGSIPRTESQTNKMQPTRSVFKILLGDPESISREYAQDVHCSSTNREQAVIRWAKPTCWSMKLHAGAGMGEVIYRLVNGMSDSPCICQRQHRCTHNLMCIQRKVWKNYMIKRPEKACIF